MNIKKGARIWFNYYCRRAKKTFNRRNFEHKYSTQYWELATTIHNCRKVLRLLCYLSRGNNQSYRPISLLPVISKLFEKLQLKEMKNHNKECLTRSSIWVQRKTLNGWSVMQLYRYNRKSCGRKEILHCSLTVCHIRFR